MKKEQNKNPDDWKWTTMGEIADVVGGGTPRTNDSANYDGGTIPWITPADLSGYTSKYICHGARYITEKGLEASSARMMPAGTVLFSSRAPVGYVAIASNEVSTNQGFKSFVLRSKDILPDYVYWWLKGNKDLAESFASGTTFLELSGAKAKQIPIPIAPPGRQKLIVAEIEKQFSRLDEAVASLKRAKANLKRYKAAVLKAAVEGQLTEQWRKEHPDVEPASLLLERILVERRAKWNGKGKYKRPTAPDTSELPTLPGGWIWATWGQISSWITYGFTRPMPHVEVGMPIVTAKHVVNGKIEFEHTHKTPIKAYKELSEKDRPMPGDILITKDGTIGRAAEVPVHDGFCINQSVAVIWLRFSPLNRKYLLTVIDSDLTQKPIWAKARGVAIQHLSITDFGKLSLPIPSLMEQEAIAELVASRISVINEIEHLLDANLKRAERLRQAVLAAAFSGGLKSRNIDQDVQMIESNTSSSEVMT